MSLLCNLGAYSPYDTDIKWRRKLKQLLEQAESLICLLLGRKALPPCRLNDLFRWVFFCRTVCRGMVRCGWKHWPNQPEPASPVSVDLLVSGFPPPSLCSFETGCQSLTQREHTTHAWSPIRPTGGGDCNLDLHHILLPPKQEISLLFLFFSGPYVLFFIAALLCHHRLDEQGDTIKVSVAS